MLREEVLREWGGCKEKVLQLKKKSIDNYTIMNKRTILRLNNHFYHSPLPIYNLMVENGNVRKEEYKGESKNVVEVCTEMLKVVIIEYLDDNLPLEEVFIKNTDKDVQL